MLTTTWLGIAVLWIAALGFIGVGVQPPLPEWGAILNDGQNYITLAWWITVFPGVFLALLVIGVNLIGDGLRDQLDPTLTRHRTPTDRISSVGSCSTHSLEHYSQPVGRMLGRGLHPRPAGASGLDPQR